MACGGHDLTPSEISSLRNILLRWYDKNKRDLPWRQLSSSVEGDPNLRAYAVWVSEVMLQQTQVVTVVDYYQRWMNRWPSIQSLAEALPEEIMSMWSGLGYYSRGRRLHEAALKVVNELGGVIPDTYDGLLKELPGVGEYTAAAIASIAFNRPVGVLDGNVIRVMSRVRAVGSSLSKKTTITSLRGLSNALADPSRPGDLNQALMDLGATVCTPKKPACSSCPISDHCVAFRLQENNTSTVRCCTVKQESVEECELCLPATARDRSYGVAQYPMKGKVGEKVHEHYVTAVVSCGCAADANSYLVRRRPPRGLLAGLWEMPSYSVSELDDRGTKISILVNQLSAVGFLTNQMDWVDVGNIEHVFSHRIHKFSIFSCRAIKDKCNVLHRLTGCEYKVVDANSLKSDAISTIVRKMLSLIEGKSDRKSAKRGLRTTSPQHRVKQPTLSSLWKRES